MTDRYNLAAWYVHTLTGDVNTPIDWRCIHDQRKDLPAHNYRGTLAECWSTLEHYNNNGYGVFAAINALTGEPSERKTLEHVAFIRAHVVDLDSMTAAADFERAAAAGASFVVQSSANKYHVYFRVQPYTGNEFYQIQQRKLAQVYNGDPSVIDATRVMRVPGFYHRKAEPLLVTTWPLPAIDHIRTAEGIAAELAHVNVVEHISSRRALGTAEMQAPSLQWLKHALTLVDPNELDRGEWLSLSAAFKQAGWSHASDDDLFAAWAQWCALYSANDAGENRKLWESIRDTETGWSTFERRTPIKAYIDFGMKEPPAAKPPAPPAATTAVAPVAAPAGTPLTIPLANNDVDTSSEILSEYECKEWFKGCYFVSRMGEIFTPTSRFMSSTEFNGTYGGKQFIITSTGKTTDEPWKAALRSTCWQIPKVDHVRFLPDRAPLEIVTDSLGRRGLNTYKPAIIDAVAGDVTPWLDWFDRILPDKNDQRILFEYLAHCVKFPGYKIPWAPMLQSTEGIGKTIFREVMAHALGDMYIYSPKAPELVKSGSTFNAWMRGKLLITVDEIKIDERRELIEILKPMITDNRVEIQSKGVDQDMEDNPANWLFFSNHRDAIPITRNGRRYAIFYSALQNVGDLEAQDMGENGNYFPRLFKWLRDENGLKYVAHWLLNYPIERGAISMRAPKTSSYEEALAQSRSPLEVTISEAIADGLAGFAGGYVSSIQVIAKAKAMGIRNPNTATVAKCLEQMGYVSLGRAARPYFQEDPSSRTEIFAIRSTMTIDGYGRAQGYE